MPFREKAKNLFRSSKSRTGSLSKTSTNGSTNTDRERYPSNIYAPHEMPRPKYRALPKKEHKEKLEAFSFADAWRKRSFGSAYSPMGTRAPSRRNSLFSVGRKSIGGRSVAGRSEGGRTASVASGEEKGGRRKEGIAEDEEEGGDVANVGLSRVQSKENRPPKSRPRTAEDKQPNGLPNGLHQTVTAHDHQPFSEDDFAQAMKRSNLEVPAQS